MSEPAASATLPQESLPQKVTYSEWIASRLWVEYGVPFTFEGRPYLKKLHDLDERKLLLKSGRQVEKCGHEDDLVLMADGSWKRHAEILAGDRIVSIDSRFKLSPDTVTAVFDNGIKPIRTIATRRGFTLRVTPNHPLKTLYGFTPASEVKVGSRIASVRRFSADTASAPMSDEEIRLLAYLIGDGGFTSRGITFTNRNTRIILDFKESLRRFSPECRMLKMSPRDRKRRGNFRVAYRGKNLGNVTHHPVRLLLERHGLFNTKSCGKFVPKAVFAAGVDAARMFLSRLWGCDGSRTHSKSGYPYYVYCSVSERLAKDVQSLMWKCGIPTSYRNYTPRVYRGTDKKAHLVSIETLEGRKVFEETVGKFGTEREYYEYRSNNNRDTIPIEVGERIRSLVPSMRGCRLPRWTGPRTACVAEAGLRRTLKYPPTPEKVRRYADFTGDPFLDSLCDSDVMWDEVESVEDGWEARTVGIETAGTHTYVSEGVVTHNTSTEAAKLVSWSCLRPGWKSLYVSPSQKQTRVFSHARLDKVLASPFVRGRYFDPKRCVDDVYEKTYLNGSTTWLSYANTTADRARGISSDLLLADEIQDMVIDVFPVLEETLSHSPNPYQVYTGTPKTLNNSMEAHWKNSTQCEWLVHCFGCGDWVFQDERVVRKEGPTCPKCGKILDPQFGRWEPFGKEDAEFAGFRIPQTIVPWIAGMPAKWAELFRKHEKWPQQQFYNEVLGLAHEKGANPLTESDIKKCCSDRGMYEHRPADMYFDALYAGVDWGAGIRSYTVVFVIGQNSDKLHVLYAKRFAEERGEPGIQVDEIARICQRFGVSMAGCDWGGGFVQNHQLSLDLTGTADVIQFYESGTKKRDITYEQKSRLYTFNRNAGLYSVIDGIKNGQYVFPRWEEFQEFAEDFTCVFEDYNTAMRMMTLDHPVDMPDDALHALLFATCTFRVARGLKAFS